MVISALPWRTFSEAWQLFQWMFFIISGPNFPWCNLSPFLYCTTWYLGGESAPHLATPSFQAAVTSNKVTLSVLFSRLNTPGSLAAPCRTCTPVLCLSLDSLQHLNVLLVVVPSTWGRSLLLSCWPHYRWSKTDVFVLLGLLAANWLIFSCLLTSSPRTLFTRQLSSQFSLIL